MKRRSFCLLAGASAVAARAQARFAVEHQVSEFPFTSGKSYRDPFNEVELDVIFTAPDGTEQRVPAFWAGEQTWRVRYAAPVAGPYKFRTVCNDTGNADLHSRTGVLDVESYRGDNPLYRHGAIRVAEDRRHFEHADGTPFFWLGDTWWMGLCKRLHWPDEFQRLAADRVAKGFTVIQIIAGLYPDMPPFDPRGANEAGYPWEKDYARINPAYFDMADLRIQYLVERGLGAVHRRLLGLFPALDGRAEDEAALAQSDRALGRLSGGLVPGRRGHHALLPFEDPERRHAPRRNRAGPSSPVTCARPIRSST